VSGGEYGSVAGVEGRAEKEDSRESAGDLSEVAGFVFVQRTAQQRLFAIAEPLLEDLVSAKRVIPHVDRDSRPEGSVIEIDVNAAGAEEGEGVVEGEILRGGEGGEAFEFWRGPVAFGGFAPAGHDGVALPTASPAGGKGEAGGVAAIAVDGGMGFVVRKGRSVLP
jgi:hypothetical protein